MNILATLTQDDKAFIRYIGNNTEGDESDVCFWELEGLNCLPYDSVMEVKENLKERGMVVERGRGSKRFMYLTQAGRKAFEMEIFDAPVKNDRAQRTKPLKTNVKQRIANKGRAKLWIQIDDMEPRPYAIVKAREFTAARKIIVRGVMTPSQEKYIRKFQEKLEVITEVKDEHSSQSSGSNREMQLSC